MLSLGCRLRQDIVADMLHHELRAASIGDAIARVRAILDSGMMASTEELEPVLADLEGLAAMPVEAAASVQTRHLSTATARRADVLRLLSDPATAVLSDREIARRVGVSPQTVGNIRRRRMAA